MLASRFRGKAGGLEVVVYNHRCWGRVVREKREVRPTTLPGAWPNLCSAGGARSQNAKDATSLSAASRRSGVNVTYDAFK